ncbi:MAG: hypothetical protein Kow00109_27340 [Acidobacteriota bacterium]
MFTNSLLLRSSTDLFPGSRGAASSSEAGRLDKIVVAEGNPAELEHYAAVLRNLNFTVLTARDGKSALALVRRHRPLLVIADLNLPLLDGYQLAQRLREEPETEGIPLMFIVDSGTTPDQEVGHQTFAHDYIQRPVSVEEFKRRVLALVRRPSPGAAGARGKEEPAPPRMSESPAGGAENGGKTPREEEPTERWDRAAWSELIREVRGLIRELNECLNRLEHRLRLSSALADPGWPAEDWMALRTPPPVEPAERPGPGVPSAEEEQRPAAEGPVAEEDVDLTGGVSDLLEQLERYRADFRRWQASRGSETAELTGERGEELPEPGETGRPGEVPGEGAPQPEEKRTWEDRLGAEREPGPSEIFPFDARLLGEPKEGAEASWRKIRSQELADSARQSYLSAYLEERASRAPGNGNLYDDLTAFVLQAIRRAAVGGAPFRATAEQLVGRMIKALQVSDELLARALNRRQLFSVTGHSVNVAVIALRVGLEAGESENFLSRLGVAALLHEIGVVRLPERLIFREAPLSEEELSVLRRRALFSAQVLRQEFGPVEEIVAQVFEREDGSGAPLGLRGAEIRPEAKILGVADCFEACIHDRPYRKPMSAYKTLWLLARAKEFDREVVRHLVRALTPFPLNELVRLDGGEVARVVRVHRENPERPVVRVVLDAAGKWPDRDIEIDLAQVPHRRITGIMTEPELDALQFPA